MRIPCGEDGSDLGSGLYNTPSYANHSCVPNVMVFFSQSTLEYICSKSVKAGEELFISYCDERFLYFIYLNVIINNV